MTAASDPDAPAPNEDAVGALFKSAVSLHQAGQPLEAEHIYRRILAANPSHAGALHLLGLIAFQFGHRKEALDLIGRAIQSDGGQAVYHANLGKLLRGDGRIEEAVAVFQTATALAPDDRGTRWNLGEGLLQLGRFQELAEAFQPIVQRDQDDADAHTLLGAALLKLERPEEALAAFQATVRLTPEHGPAHANIASALDRLNRLEACLAANDEAIRHAPDYAPAHVGRGVGLHALGRYQEAVAAYERAIALDPANGSARVGLAGVRLRLGDWINAWPDFERRWDAVEMPEAFTQPQWRGEDLAGSTILLHAEQGAGDTIQFCRYAPLVAGRGARVLLRAPRRIIRLLSALEGVDQWVAEGDPLPPYDYHCPLMSLPGVFATTLQTVPAKLAYLKPEPEQVRRWSERIGDDGFRIGIAWQGDPNSPSERGRSVPVAAFAPLAAVPGVRLISLQKGPGTEQLGSLPAGMEVQALGEDFDSGPDAFVDTAAVMANLDLVVTVDTSAGALAGALGRPVWIALQRVPHWIWTTTGETSPWYPSVRLFRQTERGDWEGLFQRIAEALKVRLAANHPGS